MKPVLAIHKTTHDRIFRSQDYNFTFEYSTGRFVRWGRTLEDDPEVGPSPEILDIEISEICHKGCTFCYKSNTTSGRWMTFPTFKSIFDKLPKTVTQIAFGTGTLSANPHTWLIMEYCRKHFVVPNITINGYKTAGREYDSLAKYCGSVAVSHYNDDECFDAVRALTERGMKQINIHKLVSQETFESCMDLIGKTQVDSRLAKLNCIVFLMLKPKGSRNTLHGLDQLKQYRQLIDYAEECKVGIGFDSCSAPAFLQVIEGRRNYAQVAQYVEPCESSLFSLYCNVAGEFFPCSFAEGTPGWERGLTIREDFLQDIWHHPRLQAFRTHNLQNCRNCILYNLRLKEDRNGN